MSLAQIIVMLTLGTMAVLALAQITSPLAVAPVSTPTRERMVGALVATLCLVFVLAGCAPQTEVGVDHACDGKRGRHVLYDGVKGWTGTVSWNASYLDFYPEGMDGGKYAFSLTVPCTALTPVTQAQPE